MDKRPFAIMGFAESFSSPEVAWSLTDAGFRVLAFARKGSRAALRVSRHAVVFDVTPPERDVAATLRELTIELERLLRSTDSRSGLLPLDDAALWLCTQLKPNPKLAVVGPSHPEVALRKDLQISVAREVGFLVPKTLVAESKRHLSPAPFGFPLILKPSNAISIRENRLAKARFHICYNASEYNSAAQQFMEDEPLLVQEYISGVGEGLFGLARQHGVSAWSAHRRIRMMNPLGSGSSACVSVAAKPADVAAGAKFVERIKWSGPFMLELLLDHEGKTWFMEFNGRMWGSTALSRQCGLEYPAWGVWEALGHHQAIPMTLPSVGVVCRHAGREVLHGLFVLRGSRSKSQPAWPRRSQTLRQLLKFSNSERWYNWRQDDWPVFTRDILATLTEPALKKLNLR
jgi:hypothetical protein